MTAPSPTVLALDDESGVLTALRRAMLEFLDLEIATTTDPLEALRILGEQAPKVFITDFSMPVMDGVAVLREARRLAPDTVRILLTARAERGHIIEAINEGRIFRFVTKPWENEDLAGIVREALDAYELRQRPHAASLDTERERLVLLESLKGVGELQRSFLPGAELSLATGTASCFATPCEYATGDYVDVFPLDGRRTVLASGDVAGHGVEAALFGFATRTVLRTGLLEGDGLSKTMERVNRALARDQRDGRFVTLFVGIHDAARETLSYASAGHMPAILCSGGEQVELNRTGMPLGVLDEAEFPEVQVPFRGGDLLVAYSDGVTEARDGAADLFGEERVLATVRRAASRPPANVVAAVRTAVSAFARDAWRQDDVSLIAYRAAAPVAGRKPAGARSLSG